MIIKNLIYIHNQNRLTFNSFSSGLNKAFFSLSVNPLVSLTYTHINSVAISENPENMKKTPLGPSTSGSKRMGQT